MQLVKADQGSSTGSSYPPPVHRTVTDDGILTEPKSEQRKYDPESGKRIGMKVVHPQTRSQTSHLASGWLLTWLLGVYLCAITSPTPGLIFFFFGYCEIYIVTKDATTGIQARQLDLSTLSWTWYSVFINARSCRICTSKRLTKLDVLEMQGVATFAVRATVVGWILWDGYSKAWLGKSTEVVGVVLKLVLAAVLVWALCRRKRAEAKAKGELTD